MRSVKEMTQSARKWICALSVKRKKELIVFKEMKRQDKVGILPNFLDDVLRGTAFVYDLKQDGTLEAFSVNLTTFVSVLRMMKKKEKAAAFLRENKLLQRAVRTRSFPVLKEALGIVTQLSHELDEKEGNHSFLSDLIFEERAALLHMLVEKQSSPTCLHLNENKKHLVRRNKTVPIFTQILEGLQRQKEEKDFAPHAFKAFIGQMSRPSFPKQVLSDATVYDALIRLGGALACYRNNEQLKQLRTWVRKAGGADVQQEFMAKVQFFSRMLHEQGENRLPPCPVPSVVEQQTNKICFLMPFDELPPCPRALAVLDRMKTHTR